MRRRQGIPRTRPTGPTNLNPWEMKHDPGSSQCDGKSAAVVRPCAPASLCRVVGRAASAHAFGANCVSSRSRLPSRVDPPYRDLVAGGHAGIGRVCRQQHSQDGADCRAVGSAGDAAVRADAAGRGRRPFPDELRTEHGFSGLRNRRRFEASFHQPACYRRHDLRLLVRLLVVGSAVVARVLLARHPGRGFVHLCACRRPADPAHAARQRILHLPALLQLRDDDHARLRRYHSHVGGRGCSPPWKRSRDSFTSPCWWRDWWGCTSSIPPRKRARKTARLETSRAERRDRRAGAARRANTSRPAGRS